MANRWGINDRLYFLGIQNHCGGDCSHEIKRHLLLRRKAMTNLDSVLKSRDLTWLTQVCMVKAMVFPVVMYGCESWTKKKAEHQGIDAFELWCWRRLLRVPWTARRSNQSTLKEINPEYSLEGLMQQGDQTNPQGNKPWILIERTTAELRLQYFDHLMRRANSMEKTLMLGKIDGKRRRGGQRMRWSDSITYSVDMNLSSKLETYVYIYVCVCESD